MENKVIKKDNDLCIIDSDGIEKLKIKNVKYYKVTKNFLEVKFQNIYLKKLGFNYDNMTTLQIIDICTLDILYTKIIKYVPYVVYRDTYITDYVYLHPSDNCLYNANKELLLESIHHFISHNKIKGVLIVSHFSGNFSFVYQNKVLIKEANYIQLLSKEHLLLVLKDNVISVYDIRNINEMNPITSIKLQRSCRNRLFTINSKDTAKAICIDYYADSLHTLLKCELRSISDLSKFIEIPKSNAFVNKYSYYGFIEFEIYDSYKKQIGSKLFSLDSFEYLSEDLAYNFSLLQDDYLVVNYLNGLTCVYSLPDCKLLLSGDYTNISLSKSQDYFIISKEDLKGIASLEGKIILNPTAYYLEERNNLIYYSTVPLNVMQKDNII